MIFCDRVLFSPSVYLRTVQIDCRIFYLLETDSAAEDAEVLQQNLHTHCDEDNAADQLRL